ncbi:MAG: hypothetical protein WBA42_21350 [Mesorhizobium sp.]
MVRSKKADSHLDTQGIWKWDIARDRVYGDANLSEFFNVSRQSCASGTGIEAYLSAIVEDDRGRVVDAIRYSVENRSMLWQGYRIQTASRDIRTILAAGRCYDDGTGNPDVHLGWFVDVTGIGGIEALHDPGRCVEFARDLAHRESLPLVAYLLENVLEEIDRAFSVGRYSESDGFAAGASSSLWRTSREK